VPTVQLMARCSTAAVSSANWTWLNELALWTVSPSYIKSTHFHCSTISDKTCSMKYTPSCS